MCVYNVGPPFLFRRFLFSSAFQPPSISTKVQPIHYLSHTAEGKTIENGKQCLDIDHYRAIHQEKPILREFYGKL
ncbi:hypothetical protein BC936DRAFT_137990 [Jimgerdemannia flammicorona]|uniref:Uncharacterized protein n=1 Tax=Jimgerdemannia flammicorona TaxID=994334 RepID=A0A433CW46_9FUNG|nr:hypothetical protein BC936DRAFT_137990 [Jimgerdemannia flammicorona]